MEDCPLSPDYKMFFEYRVVNSLLDSNACMAGSQRAGRAATPAHHVARGPPQEPAVHLCLQAAADTTGTSTFYTLCLHTSEVDTEDMNFAAKHQLVMLMADASKCRKHTHIHVIHM